MTPLMRSRALPRLVDGLVKMKSEELGAMLLCVHGHRNCIAQLTRTTCSLRLIDFALSTGNCGGRNQPRHDRHQNRQQTASVA